MDARVGDGAAGRSSRGTGTACLEFGRCGRGEVPLGRRSEKVHWSTPPGTAVGGLVRVRNAAQHGADTGRRPHQRSGMCEHAGSTQLARRAEKAHARFDGFAHDCARGDRRWDMTSRLTLGLDACGARRGSLALLSQLCCNEQHGGRRDVESPAPDRVVAEPLGDPTAEVGEVPESVGSQDDGDNPGG